MDGKNSFDGEALPRRGVFMENWYVLFVKNGSEYYVRDVLNHQLDTTRYISFIPTKHYPHISAGKTQKVVKQFFPGGYVFISSENDPICVIKDLRPVIYNIKNIYRLLNYGENKNHIVMHPEERDCIKQLLNHDFNADCSYGFIEGDKVRVTEGAMTGMENRIVSINKRKKTVKIKSIMFGAIREVILMLDMIEKI